MTRAQLAKKNPEKFKEAEERYPRPIPPDD